MKKTRITILMAGLLLMTGVKAQTLQDGINHLYADRFTSAVDVFQKLLAVNPNNIDATYWLGQTYLDMDDNAAARQVYEKALATSANAPLLIVGMGHVELLEKKTNDARQRFETAITMTRTKKGDDPVILNAIGRANVDAKMGDIAYAIEKLKAAADKDPKNPDIFLNLGNAYRKARPGEGGGDAYLNYKKALEINPNFVYAYVRLAKLFETQENWDLVLDNLNEAITREPKFSIAYRDLFDYYYYDKPNFTEAEKYLQKYIESKLPEKDIDDDYLYGQLCYIKKDFACTIAKCMNVVSARGERTKPKVYKLLAYAYLDKGDTTGAQQWVDAYFKKEKLEDIIPMDYKLKADVYAGIPGSTDFAVRAFLDAANVDTTVKGKVNWYKKAADLLRSKGDRIGESAIREMIYKTKPKPTNLDIFDWGLAAYFSPDYVKADSVFGLYADRYPDETFGWLWKARSESNIDTSMQQGLAVASFQKLLDIAAKDSVKYQKEFLEAAKYLVGYYNNILKDKDKALDYTLRILNVDPNNLDWQKIRDMLMKPPPKQGGSTPPKNNSTGKTNGN